MEKAPASSAATLLFQPFASAIDVPFWFDFTKKKLDQWKLSEEPTEIIGTYSASSHADVPSLLNLGMNSLNHTPTPANQSEVKGLLYQSNTIESFKELDKKAILNKASTTLFDHITSGKATQDPTLLTPFLLVCFGDLKKYRYYYMLAVPALVFPGNDQPTASPPVPIASFYNANQVESFKQGIQSFRTPQKSFFLIKKTDDNSVAIGNLSQWEEFSKDSKEKVTVGFVDPCGLAANPGWPLRNLLVLAAVQWKLSKVSVLCYREGANRDVSKSIVLDVNIPAYDTKVNASGVGWEKNKDGKTVPKMIDLAPMMDPARLAGSAVDLNLKLMKWRLMPSLDLDTISNSKCLIVGAGTLGCNFARSLMAWGVKTITFIDNGKVSYSNPVRQWLYEFDDCLNGGKSKALAAAAKLTQIYPGITAMGHQLTIPMPGHPVPQSEVPTVLKEIDTFSKLIDDHDVIFLGTDSREARWLPSLLACSKNKLLINAALGFDTYLVMRHGSYEAPKDGSPRLGCYFCNDVVAPVDSLTNRTLDQQCTVTRPAGSNVAAALAVELMVSVLQHPLRTAAPADENAKLGDAFTTNLGMVPHQLRGFLAYFNNVIVVGHAYDKCTACSQKVVEEYRKHGNEFLLRVFNEPKYLEDLTGLTQLHQESADLSIEWVEDDDPSTDSKDDF